MYWNNRELASKKTWILLKYQVLDIDNTVPTWKMEEIIYINPISRIVMLSNFMADSFSFSHFCELSSGTPVKNRNLAVFGEIKKSSKLFQSLPLLTIMIFFIQTTWCILEKSRGIWKLTLKKNVNESYLQS